MPLLRSAAILTKKVNNMKPKKTSTNICKNMHLFAATTNGVNLVDQINQHKYTPISAIGWKNANDKQDIEGTAKHIEYQKIENEWYDRYSLRGSLEQIFIFIFGARRKRKTHFDIHASATPRIWMATISGGWHFRVTAFVLSCTEKSDTVIFFAVLIVANVDRADQIY